MHGRKVAPTTGIQDAQELLDPQDPCHPKDLQDRDPRNLGRYKFTSNTISFQSFLRQMTVLTRYGGKVETTSVTPRSLTTHETFMTAMILRRSNII